MGWIADVVNHGWRVSFTMRFGGPKPDFCKAWGKSGVCGKTREEHRQMTHIFQEAKS